MTTSLPRNSAPRTLQVAFSAADGSADKPVAVPAWTLSDSTLGTIAPATDGFTAVVTFAEQPGALVVTASADNVSATFEFDLQALPVASAVITDITPAG